MTVHVVWSRGCWPAEWSSIVSGITDRNGNRVLHLANRPRYPGAEWPTDSHLQIPNVYNPGVLKLKMDTGRISSSPPVLEGGGFQDSSKTTTTTETSPPPPGETSLVQRATRHHSLTDYSWKKGSRGGSLLGKVMKKTVSFHKNVDDVPATPFRRSYLVKVKS